MKLINLKITSLIFVTILLSNQFASAQAQSAFTFASDIYLDYVNAFKGGIKTGDGVLGNIDLMISFDTEKAKLWKGGTFFAYGIHDFGYKPSAQNVGCYQPFDNIETYDKDQLLEFWYKQQFKKGYIIFGQSNVNYNFFHLDNGNNFINGNFNCQPDVAGNISISTFSKNTLGVKWSWKLNQNFTYKGCIYNGYTGTPDDNPYDLEYRFGKKEGFFTTHQLGYKIRKDSVVTTAIKAGIWYHSGTFINGIDSTEYKGKVGLYGSAERLLMPFSGDNSRGISAFLIAGYVPDKYSIVKFYYAYGLNITGIFPKRKNDILGIGLANTIVNQDIANLTTNNSHSQENIFEMYYLLKLSNNFTFSPDFQYTASPGGSPTINNAFTAILRLIVSFN